MYGYVKDDKIVETFSSPKAMVVDDITYSAQIFTAWSDAELNAIGIYKVNAGVMGDERFETTSSPSYTWDSTKKEINTTYTKSDKTLSDLKAQAIIDTNMTANTLISYGKAEISQGKVSEKKDRSVGLEKSEVKVKKRKGK